MLAFSTDKAHGQDYSGAVPAGGHAAQDAATVSQYSQQAANDVSLEQAKSDAGIGFDTAAAGNPLAIPSNAPLGTAPAPSVTDYNPPPSEEEEGIEKGEGTQEATSEGNPESQTTSTSSDQSSTSSSSSYVVPASIAAAAFAPSIANFVPQNNAPQYNAPVEPVPVEPVPVQPVPIAPTVIQPAPSNIVSQNQVSLNSQISKIMSSIDSIQVPAPLQQKDVSLSWKEVLLDKDHSEALLQVSDIGLLAWDMAGKIGSKINFPCKVLMIAGKTFIAGEDGALLYLIEKDKSYDDALGYLKDPATSKRFVQLVRDIKEGKSFFSFDSKMVKAARAIDDPKNGSSGMALAWDSMLSPQAKAAMVKKGCMEIGTELVSTGTEGLVKELTERKGVFEAARIERKQAESLLKQATESSDKAQLVNAIQKTEKIMEDTYKIQEAGPKALGTIEGIYVSTEAEKSQVK